MLDLELISWLMIALWWAVLGIEVYGRWTHKRWASDIGVPFKRDVWRLDFAVPRTLPTEWGGDDVTGHADDDRILLARKTTKRDVAPWFLDTRFDRLGEVTDITVRVRLSASAIAAIALLGSIFWMESRDVAWVAGVVAIGAVGCVYTYARDVHWLRLELDEALRSLEKTNEQQRALAKPTLAEQGYRIS